MTPEGYTYWGASIIPAVSSFLLNSVLRGKDVLKSSGADWLLILFSFDLTSVMAANELSKFVPHPEVRAALTTIVTASLIITLLTWLFVVRHLEPILALPSTGVGPMLKKIGGFFMTWLLIIFISAAHIFLFLYKDGG